MEIPYYFILKMSLRKIKSLKELSFSFCFVLKMVYVFLIIIKKKNNKHQWVVTSKRGHKNLNATEGQLYMVI